MSRSSRFTDDPSLFMKFDLTISPPLMNAAGTLGFAPVVELAGLGAFITNPLSLGSRTPAQSRAAPAFPGGILIHSGYPNPGLKAVIRRYARRWSNLNMPVIVHLLAQNRGYFGMENGWPQ